MSDEYNMPEAADEDRQKKSGGGGRPRSLKVQRLRPYKEGDTVANHLQYLLFNPSVFDMYRGVVDPKYRTYWMPLYFHYMGANNKDRTTALCKKKMNNYYAEKFGAPIVFAPVICPTCGTPGVFANCVKCHASLGMRVRDDLCPSCDEAERWWRKYNAEWVVQLQARGLGSDPDARYKIKRENLTFYKELTGSGTQLRHLQEVASNWSPSDRFVYIVFDIDKMQKRRSLMEGEPEETTMTLLFSGTTVQEALEQKHKNQKRFWDASVGMEIVVTRDTRNGLERAEYKVDDAAGPTFTPDWIAYFTNYAVMPDPSTEVQVLAYDDHVNKAGLALTREEVVAAPAQPGQPPASAPVTAPAAPPAGVPAAGPPVQPPQTQAPMGIGRPQPAPAPFTPPAAPPTTAPSAPAPAPFTPPAAPTTAGPPPLTAVPSAPPLATAPPPAAPPAVPAGAPAEAAPPAPTTPQDNMGRRQTW